MAMSETPSNFRFSFGRNSGFGRPIIHYETIANLSLSSCHLRAMVATANI